MLFFVHERSHQDIATFLNLPVVTVNNRLHAARRTPLLKEIMHRANRHRISFRAETYDDCRGNL